VERVVLRVSKISMSLNLRFSVVITSFFFPLSLHVSCILYLRGVFVLSLHSFVLCRMCYLSVVAALLCISPIGIVLSWS